MSKLDQDIRDAIKALAGGKRQVIQATVKSVSDSTCDVTLPGGLDIDGVRLRAITGNTGLLLKPAVGSEVLIARLMNSDDFFVIMFSKVSTFSISNETVSLKTELDALLTALSSAIVQTPSGPGSFAANTITAINNVKTKLNQLLG